MGDTCAGCILAISILAGIAAVVIVSSDEYNSFSTPIDFIFTGNYSIVLVEKFQYRSYCHAITENSNECTYLLDDINFDMPSAINYSIDNCIVNETRDGSFDEKKHECFDKHYNEYDHRVLTIVMWVCVSLFFLPCGLCIVALIVHVTNCNKYIENTENIH